MVPAQVVVDLGRALEWALYWIRTLGEVPVPPEGMDDWERWEAASQALGAFGPESGYVAEAYLDDFRRRRATGGAGKGDGS